MNERATTDRLAASARAALDELSRVNSELTNLQRELARGNAELRRLDEQKNLLLGMAAHDLRTPIGVILTFSEFLHEEAAHCLTPEQQEFLTIIRTTSSFMLRLVDDVLDLSKIEAGRLELDVQEHDLEAIVDRHVRLHDVLAQRKGIRVELRSEAAGTLRSAALDAGRFEQVLDNVIGNAVKFSPAGSTVIVRLAREAGECVLSVSDQGPGLAPQDLERIFKPFVKTGPRGSAGEACTGLGLAIVRRIVEGHGGAIRAESSREGAVFTIRMPVTGQVAACLAGSST